MTETPDRDGPTSRDDDEQQGIPTVRRSRHDDDVTSTSLDEGRFAPGTLLADRYRIVARLGHGGMGEVYRADDLQLGQAVALKFLPGGFTSDERHLRRLREEVRIAREIAHPHVCRTYDIGAADGEHFISMEFVDGEDLAGLLKRIGRLPKDKAIQIARQLCAGIAAAHDKGVLHRDLKPANIMLDGRGNVRITDFGIAAVADRLDRRDARTGTPAYMAPEQLDGDVASVRSDVYALGLVLYEVFTGREAYHADSVAELERLRRTATPSTPSTLIEDMDPVVERVIMRCLERDPADRPSSVIAVAAALPGGDPLAMALAAGETPSPEMVAQAGESGGLKPAVAVSCLVAFVIFTLLAIFARDRVGLLAVIPFDKPPAVLVDRARQAAERLGFEDVGGGEAWYFLRPDPAASPITEIETRDEEADRWAPLATGRPPVVRFRYRGSPSPLAAHGMRGRVGWDDPPMRAAGAVRIELDPEGRLLRFEAVPPDPLEDTEGNDDGDGVSAALEPSPPNAGAPWHVTLFELAELEEDDLMPASPVVMPAVPADERRAWTGTWPTASEVALRVEAAAYDGQPVFFELYGPWDMPDGDDTSGGPNQGFLVLFFITLLLLILVIAGLLALRNLRVGRGDRRGAWRLACGLFAIVMLRWLFTADHVRSLVEIVLLYHGFCLAAGLALLCWLLYMALEPYARRYYPQALIGWTRLLSGRLRDPMVGRDVLVGSLCGVALDTIARHLPWLLAPLTGAPPSPPTTLVDLSTLLGTRRMIGFILEAPTDVTVLLGMFVLLILLRVVFRRLWIAAIVFGILFLAPSLQQLTDVATWIAGIASVVTLLVVMLRFGLLALLAFVVSVALVVRTPGTFDLSAWYAGLGMVGPLTALALVGYGFWTSLAGRPIFKDQLAGH